MLHAHVSSVVLIAVSPRHFRSLLLPHLHLSDHPVLPTARQLQLPRCGGQIPCALPLRTSAPWPRTSLPQVVSPTTTSSRRLMSSTPRSTGEQRFPDDFDCDDVTIGKTLLDACRRRADHSEEEGLSSCLSSSVSHDRTWRPVVCRLVSSAQETQRHNLRMNRLGLSWSDKESRFSLTVKQKFENTNSRPITTEEVFKK